MKEIFFIGVATLYYWCKKKIHHNFLRVVIFDIYFKGGKKVGCRYLCHLTFMLSKFTLKNFIFLEMVYDIMVSPNILFYFFVYLAFIVICVIMMIKFRERK